MSQLTLFEYGIIAAYLAGTVAFGVWIGRRMHSGKDYFLAGRTLPWWLIGMSLVATDIGGTDIVGVGGAAYTYGLAVGNFEWIGCVPAMIVSAFLFVPFFWRLGITTIPEFMERRYNVGVRLALAVCWFVFMACNLGVMLFASAKMMTETFGLNLAGRQLIGFELGGWEINLCIVCTACLVAIYTVSGGLEAIVYTDAVQCTVMIAGCLFVVVMGLTRVGGIGALREQVTLRENEQRQARIEELLRQGNATPDALAERKRLEDPSRPRPERLSLILPVDSRSPFPWPGILFGLAMVLSPAYWIGNQAIVQRSLGARSEFHAKASYVWGALLKSVIPLIIAVPGLIAFALYPDLADGDRAVPRLIAAMLPTGFRGLFLAAFLAALMSNVDSYLNSAAAIFTHDFYCRFVRRDASPQHILSVGRWTTFALVVWAILFGSGVAQMQQSIYSIFQTLMSFFQGPALAILLAGVLWRRATGAGALAGFLSGVATSMTLFLLSRSEIAQALSLQPLFQIPDPYLYFSVWAFLVAATVLVVVSYLTAPEPDEKVRGLLYSRQSTEQHP